MEGVDDIFPFSLQYGGSQTRQQGGAANNGSNNRNNAAPTNASNGGGGGMKTRNKATNNSRQTMNGVALTQVTATAAAERERERDRDENVPPGRGAAIKKDTVGKAGGQAVGTFLFLFLLTLLTSFSFLQIADDPTW